MDEGSDKNGESVYIKGGAIKERETAKRSGCQERKERVSAVAGGFGLEIMG